jgi:energy-coupling factor transporter ATP-binding protein EcfA2
MIPSRHSNPFATCWTRPGAIPFRFGDGQSAAALVSQLAAQNGWGQIIGPHGSGKTTLLATLAPLLEEARRAVTIVDGYERLGRIARWRLRRRCRREGVGLLVTSHVSCGLVTLIELAPGRALVDQLVARLCDGVSTPIKPADVAASHARHGSNVREILFDLYDRHERLSRLVRTAASPVA